MGFLKNLGCILNVYMYVDIYQVCLWEITCLWLEFLVLMIWVMGFLRIWDVVWMKFWFFGYVSCGCLWTFIKFDSFEGLICVFLFLFTLIYETVLFVDGVLIFKLYVNMMVLFFRDTNWNLLVLVMCWMVLNLECY